MARHQTAAMESGMNRRSDPCWFSALCGSNKRPEAEIIVPRRQLNDFCASRPQPNRGSSVFDRLIFVWLYRPLGTWQRVTKDPGPL
jgi:hypothetical protein